MNTQPTVLVTGAQGFVGRVVMHALLTKGFHLKILTRRKNKASLDLGAQVEMWTGDLTSPDTLSGVAEDVDLVYHLAGEIRNSLRFDAVNRLGTENLLAECKKEKVRRFLYLSSVGVMGGRGEPVVLDEDSSACPGNAYEVSKFTGEQAVLASHNPDGMQVMILRPSIIYGEGRLLQDDSFLKWIRMIKARRFVQFGDAYVNSYIYIGDVAAACLAIMNDSRSGGEVYIINEPISLSAFVAELAAGLKMNEPRKLPTSIGRLAEKVLRKTGRFTSLYNRTIYQMDKLTALGFTLPFGYRKGIRHTLEWYNEKGLLD